MITVPFISWSSDFALYIEYFWCMNIKLRDYASEWPDVCPQINVDHCDLYFMIQWLCLISRRLFDVWTSYFGIMSQYDTTFDLKINVDHCDLNFMVQWFLPYILKTIQWLNIILWDYESTWPNGLTSKYLQVTVTYIVYSNALALYLEDYSMYEHYTLI